MISSERIKLFRKEQKLIHEWSMLAIKVGIALFGIIVTLGMIIQNIIGYSIIVRR